MSWRRIVFISLLSTSLVLMSCQRAAAPTSVPTVAPTPTASAEGAETVANDYCRAWQNGAYERMYAMLSPAAAARITSDAFVNRHRSIAAEASMTAITLTIMGVHQVADARAEVPFKLSMDTLLAGRVESDNTLQLVYENGWAVDWTPAAIFPLLTDDNLVHMFVKAPARGNIYDRRDLPLANEGEIIQVGVVPGQIQDEERLLDALSRVLGIDGEKIRSRYAGAGRPDWFMPVGDITPESAAANKTWLETDAGITWRSVATRSYPHGALAGHVLGYIAEISAEELKQQTARGYEPGDLVGKMGLERWGEEYLAGNRGGQLAIINPDGRIVLTLGERPAEPSRSIYTTLDPDVQRVAEEALQGRVGAIVAMDVRTGDILAMASYPSFSPAILSGGATAEQWQALLSDGNHPFLNRATSGVYPPGSTFKVVTMAAGMEELGLSPHESYYCAGLWDGLADGFARTCWVPTGHGSIDLSNALVQSCDSAFWSVGKALNDKNPGLLSQYARDFGLGAPTGLHGLDEADGLVPDPEWKAQHYSGQEQNWLPRDAINMCIGQGDLLTTPLQMASVFAAIANGGTVYRPRLVRRAASLMGGDAIEFPVETVRTLPVSPEHLAAIRRGLEGVAAHGTGSAALAGASIAMAGKTGTAEAPPKQPHAWFVGYAPVQDPLVAVAVVLEHGGEGGRDAAPLFRKVVEAFLKVPGQ